MVWREILGPGDVDWDEERRGRNSGGIELEETPGRQSSTIS
jgi:hypothetical protein